MNIKLNTKVLKNDNVDVSEIEKDTKRKTNTERTQYSS